MAAFKNPSPAEAMNRILSECCVSRSDIMEDDKVWNEYEVETHCMSWKIIARVIDQDDNGFQYEIRRMTGSPG